MIFQSRDKRDLKKLSGQTDNSQSSSKALLKKRSHSWYHCLTLCLKKKSFVRHKSLKLPHCKPNTHDTSFSVEPTVTTHKTKKCPYTNFHLSLLFSKINAIPNHKCSLNSFTILCIYLFIYLFMSPLQTTQELRTHHFMDTAAGDSFHQVKMAFIPSVFSTWHR